MTAEREGEQATRGPLWKRLLGWAGGAVLAALLLLAALRVFIPPVPPGQSAPEGHFDAPCAVCHIVTHAVDEAADR